MLIKLPARKTSPATMRQPSSSQAGSQRLKRRISQSIIPTPPIP